MLAESTLTRVAPVAGIAITHELMDGIELESSATADWRGTNESSHPLVIRHEVGDVSTRRMRRVLDVPPWCTFHVDERGEPSSRFHAVFGEVDRLLSCEAPGSRYVVRYGQAPHAPVVALQSELTAFAFALAARGSGLIAHSCAFILPEGQAVLCPGMSGAGKTTLARLLRDNAPAIDLLTDDRAIVTLEDRLTLWGSPWPGSARVSGSGSALLSAVMFIRHGHAVALRRVPPGEAFRRMVNSLSMPLWEPARCGRALEIVNAIVSQATLLEAAYPPTADAARRVTREMARLLR
ncbi:MAG TPA: hypothetical protein VFW03_22135 [Gemmatimonadaceae bacterium]|nr:hypothetical protein [Gemmatimonadaceae bacterium]